MPGMMINDRSGSRIGVDDRTSMAVCMTVCMTRMYDLSGSRVGMYDRAVRRPAVHVCDSSGPRIHHRLSKGRWVRSRRSCVSYPTVARIHPRLRLVIGLLGHLGDLYAESGRTCKGSFSAVSTPIFASKYSLESSRRDLQNALLCAVLDSNPAVL